MNPEARLQLEDALRCQWPWQGTPVVRHQVASLLAAGCKRVWLEGVVPPEVAAALSDDPRIVFGAGPRDAPCFDCHHPLGAPHVDLRRPETVPRQGWLSIFRPRPGLVVFTEPIGLCARWGTPDVHAYLILGRHHALLVDSGTGLGGIAPSARRVAGDIWAFHTHRDWDHVGEAGAFPWVWASARPGRIPVATLRRCLRARQAAPWRPVEPDGWPLPVPDVRQPPPVIDLGGIVLHVLPAPGHTPDGLALYDAERGDLFAGDALYAGILFARDRAAFDATRRRLLALPGLRRVWGGHGPVPASPAAIRHFAALG